MNYGQMIGGSLANSSGSIAGQMLSNFYNRREANRQRDWNEDMWNRSNEYDQEMWHMQNRYNESQLANQRQWDLDMWNRQNQFNSPEAQMQRFKDAGLNPNLIYGQGNPGNAQGLTSDKVQADRLSANSYGQYNRAKIENVMRGVKIFSEFQNLKKDQAQIDLLNQQASTGYQEELLKGQQQILLALQTDSGKFDLNLKKKLEGATMETAFENLKNIQKRNEELTNRMLIQKADLTLKDLETELKKKGATWQDNPWYRYMLMNDEPLRPLDKLFEKKPMKSLMGIFNSYLYETEKLFR